jgi:exodeoxyribonuclease-3
MRIVVWNCNMAFHRKIDRILALKPDLAVIPECADPVVVARRLTDVPWSSVEWIGHSHSKGLAAFSFGDYTLRRDARFDAAYELFLPLSVFHRHVLQCNLLAVWAFGFRAKRVMKGRRDATWAAISCYSGLLKERSSIVAGDFNNNPLWDSSFNPGKRSNFRVVAKAIESCGLVSAYHEDRALPFGSERESTYFHRKGEDEYHIDYCFVPRQCELRTVEVGLREAWIKESDHAPLIVDLDL